MDAQRLLIIAGPTASGKSQLALAWAETGQAEIISADSMQVYRQLDVGTAKPSLEERQRAPHHLIDIVDLDEPFSVARFQQLAYRAIGEVNRRGRLPLLVGGTVLYIKAVVEGYDFSRAEPDPDLRRFLWARAEQMGAQELHSYLEQRDAQAARRIHPHDVRRIVRALEVYYADRGCLGPGRAAPPELAGLILALHWPRSELYRRIELRVDDMMNTGLLEEVERLYHQGHAENLRRIRALGYRELGYYLEGRCTLQEAIRLLKRNTRRYAKRQLTWLRSIPSIKWLDAGENRGTEELLADASSWMQEAWSKA